MDHKTLTALPVYNEADHIAEVLEGALRYSQDVLVVNDGSTDGTAGQLAQRSDVFVVDHPRNLGYGAALKSAFSFAQRAGYDVLVTIDCDGQHQPRMIPRFVEACRTADVVSGSRYLRSFEGDSAPPSDRVEINRQITAEVNARLGLNLTDAFCGFKAYRVAALQGMEIKDNGYAMPLEFWVRAAERGLRIVELPVPRIYLDESRSFGGALDNATARLAVYRSVLERSLAHALPWCGKDTA